jgi:hypothetical protein
MQYSRYEKLVCFKIVKNLKVKRKSKNANMQYE